MEPQSLTTSAAATRPGAIPAALARLARDRTLLTLLLVGAMAMAIGVRRPRYHTGLADSTFWARKISLRSAAEVVLAGDSRVMSGLSPRAMQPLLGGGRVVNFAFNGLGYSQDYLDRLEAVLAPSADRPTVVLGVTPAALSMERAESNEFTEWRDQGPGEIFMARHFGQVGEFFRPMRWEQLLQLPRGEIAPPQPRYEAHRRPDGSSLLHHVPQGIEPGLNEYRQMLAEGVRVEPERVEMLLARVAHWRRRGIVVYGFRPPVPPQMAELEEQFGLDYDSFRRRFAAAGGVWIDIPADRFDSTDGSHIPGDQVDDLSRLVARKIAADRLAGMEP